MMDHELTAQPVRVAVLGQLLDSASLALGCDNWATAAAACLTLRAAAVQWQQQRWYYHAQQNELVENGGYLTAAEG
jgi:hypothetical protein